MNCEFRNCVHNRYDLDLPDNTGCNALYFLFIYSFPSCSTFYLFIIYPSLIYLYDICPRD